MNKDYNLSTETKEELQRSIKNYFYEERNEEIGDLAATLFLDFIMQEIAPTFYNQGVTDAQQYISNKLEDIFEIQK
ncbi:DUF2164 domain-containing protein [Bacillus tianshenii]|nr:DUF2164 domain-containing protein [Bacillus tianshenii]